MPAIPAYSVPAISPSKTPSVTPTVTKTPSVSKTPSATPSIFSSPSTTPTVTPSVTATPTVTPSITVTPSLTPTITVTPSVSKTPSPSLTPTPTTTPSPNCSQLNIFNQMQQAALQFMQTNVAYYKHDLLLTKRNIYGESLEKWFYQPFLIKCTIERNPDTITDEMFGPDVEKTIKLTIPKVAWEDGTAGIITGVNAVPEIGDIIYDRSTERYFEIHNIIINYIPINANIGIGSAVCPQAELVTFNIDCHMTRVSRLNLSPYKIL